MRWSYCQKKRKIVLWPPSRAGPKVDLLINTKFTKYYQRMSTTQLRLDGPALLLAMKKVCSFKSCGDNRKVDEIKLCASFSNTRINLKIESLRDAMILSNFNAYSAYRLNEMIRKYRDKTTFCSHHRLLHFLQMHSD